MQLEISYDWTPELVRLATRRFIFRYAGRSLIGFAVVMIIAVFGLTFGEGVSFWWVMILLPMLYTLGWVRYYMRAVKVCDDMPDRKVAVRIEPEGITLQTSEHTTTMKWSRIKKLWSFPDVLLLFSVHTADLLDVANGATR